jgi:hypothetical protein
VVSLPWALIGTTDRSPFAEAKADQEDQASP